MNFSIQRFLAIFNARNKEFYRDKGAMTWTFAFPILVVIAFGYMFNIGGDGQFKAGYFGSIPPIKVESFQWIHFDNKKEALEKLRVHHVDFVIDTDAMPTRYWISETAPNSKIMEKLFLVAQNPHELEPTALREKISTREIPYVEWLFPGLITFNVLWMALWGVGWVIVRQRKMGILKRFKASPLSAVEYLLAQMISRLFILFITGVTVFALSHLIYPFQTVGSYFSLAIVYLLGCFSLSSVGLIVAARSSSEEFANGILNIITYPMMFLSEVWFSLEGSPEWVKSMAQFMPLWQMTDGMRKIMNEGATLFDIKWSLMGLLITSVVFTAIGSLTFKWTKS
jgi:ABC-2 type transport system permease protein